MREARAISESYCAACGAVAQPLALSCSKCESIFHYTVTVSGSVAFRVPVFVPKPIG